MKKNILFLSLLFLISCKGFEIQPLFISILGVEHEQPKLLSYQQDDNNSVIFTFSKNVNIAHSKVYLSDGRELIPSIEKIKNAENASDIEHQYLLRTNDSLGIGQPFTVICDIKDGNYTESIVLDLFGKNNNIASLQLSEYKPTAKTKTVPYSYFIELIVTKSGNLFENKIGSVGNTKIRDYIFPACEVLEGEVIVVHLSPKDEGKDVNILSDELTENISNDIPHARDFYAHFDSNPTNRKSNLIIVEDTNENVQDFLYYNTQEYSFDENDFVPDTHIQPYFEKIKSSSYYEPFLEQIKQKEILKPTGTLSLIKSNGKWVTTKNISPGIKNE